MHLNGNEHQDLKLENCLVDRNFENIYLIDFEFGCVNYETSNFSNTAGTLLYLPPESFCSIIKPQFSKKDIWALGVMFMILMYKTIPIKNNSIQSYIYFIKNIKPILDQEIRGCFNWEPTNRINILQLIRNIEKLVYS